LVRTGHVGEAASAIAAGALAQHQTQSRGRRGSRGRNSPEGAVSRDRARWLLERRSGYRVQERGRAVDCGGAQKW
jgi:hypothetical protein